MALDAIASALAQLARAGRVRSSPGDVAQFGLGDDARVVRFRSEDGDHVLRIGRATPVGGNVYVRADDDEAVAYVESFRLNALRHALSELRDRRIVGLEGESLVGLTLDWSGGDGRDGAARHAGAPGKRSGGGAAGSDGARRVVLARDAGGPWRILEPIAARADQQSVREVVSNLEYLQASGFVDERSSAVGSALQETVLEIRWTERADGADAAAQAEGAAAAAEKTGAIRIAGLVDGSRLVESDGRLYTLAPERLDDFPRAVDRYRDKQLVDLDPDALERIELEFPSAPPIVLSRGGDGWTAAERDVEPDQVATLADSLATLRAEAIVADAMGEAELAGVGLAPPAVRIRLQAGGSGAATASGATSGPADAAHAPAAIELGRLDPARGLFARRVDEPIVYALAASLAETLPLDLAAFETRYGKRDAAASDAAATEVVSADTASTDAASNDAASGGAAPEGGAP